LTLTYSSSQGSDSLTFSPNGSRLTATLPKDDNSGSYRYFKLTFKPEHPELWNEDSVKITFHTGYENKMECDNITCFVLDKSDDLDSVKFAMQMLDVRYADSLARSRYASPTEEHVEIIGWLANDGPDDAFNADTLQMELWVKKGDLYTPIGVPASGLKVDTVAHGKRTKFVVSADIPYTDSICNMLLVMRKTGGSQSNPYLPDSISMVVPKPQYEIAPVDSICQMAVDTPIGEQPIGTYKYSWSGPTAYLNATNTTPVKFTYDYSSHPVANDTVLQYLVTVTRPNSCASVDTVFVPLKGIPSVDDLQDKSVCHDNSLSVTFSDATNTSSHPDSLTRFAWTANGYINGLSSPGQGNIVDSVLTNPGSAPVLDTVVVIPTKNGCTGASKEFVVKALPQSLYNYPDLRIRACPTGTQINLAKYIDTLEVTDIDWSPPIDPSGSVATSQIASSNVRTFTYTVTNPCLATPITRKIYVERLRPNRMRPLPDTIAICYERADMVNINQIFGIDAGKGTWSYYSHSPHDIDEYVTVSTSTAYGGAVALNGKALYESGVTSVKYHGIDVKKAVFIYTPAPDSCLTGSYKIVIVLTPNLTK
jgi:hypothetical protein